MLQKFSDKPLKKHEGCGGAVERLVSTSSFQLKGGGWYAEGYAKKAPSSESKAESKSDSGGESKAADTAKSETKSESKTESKSESKPAKSEKPAKTKA